MAEESGRFEDEGWRLRKDGARFWADVVITAVRDAAGALRGFSKVTRDLTERRRGKRRCARARSASACLVEGVKDYAIYMLDPEGRVTSWNAGAERIKGYKAQEIIGRHFSAFYPQEAIAKKLAGAGARHGARARALRGGGRARAQGRRRVLGQRRDHAAVRPARRAARLRQGDARPDRAQARRGAGEGRAPDQRVPRHARARAAQSARADQQRAAPARAQRARRRRPRSGRAKCCSARPAR